MNYYDDIKIEIISNKHPDDVKLNIALLYNLHNFDIINEKSFYSSAYAFKLWDLFSDF